MIEQCKLKAVLPFNPHSGKPRLELNGVDITNAVNNIEIKAAAGDLTTVVIALYADVEIEIEDLAVPIKGGPILHALKLQGIKELKAD